MDPAWGFRPFSGVELHLPPTSGSVQPEAASWFRRNKDRTQRELQGLFGHQEGLQEWVLSVLPHGEFE